MGIEKTPVTPNVAPATPAPEEETVIERGESLAAQFTLVQHHAWAFGRDIDYAQAVQVIPVPNVRDQRAVFQSGGELFGSYAEALALAGQANDYSAAHGGLAGRFSGREVDGARVYVPLRRAVA